jgi:anaerobic magnesium-protoporphyrin IX monomethyl ester cyclase
MHILFLYSQQNTILFKKPLRGQEEISFGISYIAALLEKHGHTCELLVLNRKYGNRNRRLLAETIQKSKPGLICCSAVFSEFNFIESVAGSIKRRFPHIFLLLGGVHITLIPDESVLKTFDALCIGEGEYATLELANGLHECKPITGIQNLWVSTPTGIEKNSTRPFIANLDELPFPNRAMWQPWILNPETRLTVLLGRGCPFNCTYCCNHKLRKVSEGQYVRLRSVANVIQEIEMLTQQFPSVLQYVLEVETLGVDREWLHHLCLELHQFNSKRAMPLVFSSNLRIYPQMEVRHIFSSLKMAGFGSIVIGLESGSERVRKEVLNRRYQNNEILEAADMARRNGIEVGIFNLVGLPTETPSEFVETLLLNQQIQPDWHATSIFFPYPGTELYERVKAMGLLPEDLPGRDERQIARISYPTFHKRQIQRAFDSFHYRVYRTSTGRKRWKTAIYLIQSYVGHNRLAKTKLIVIKTLYVLRLQKIAGRLGLFGVFQK